MKYNIPGSNAPSNTRQNVENNPNLSSFEPIENTPFTLIKKATDHDPLTDDQDYIYFLTMGDYRITEPTDTKEKTMEKLEKEKWMIIFSIIAVIVEKMSNMQIKDLKQTQPLTAVDDNVTP